MAFHVVSDIDTKDFGAETVRVGDLDGDGRPDLLLVQSRYGTREITCLTGMTIHGQRLWQAGAPSSENGRGYSDLPVQVYDWDDDGANEVLYVRQAVYAEPIVFGECGYRERANRYEGSATLLVLDGRTGREKAAITLPAPADDCFLLADLTGRGRREDFVVKDRYWNIWGVSREGRVLWHWEGPTGHFPAIADIDGDGRDEVFVGYALIDHDGRVLFSSRPEEEDAHQDASYVVRLQDGTWRLLFGNHGVHCLSCDGRTLWRHPLREAQHVVAGHFRDDSPLQVAVINRGYPRTPEGEPATLHLYDLDGREIWQRRQPKGGWIAACVPITWSGRDTREILVYERGAGNGLAIYDGGGEVVDSLPVPQEICSVYHGNPGVHLCTVADVWGDTRQEVILCGWHGLRIYANARALNTATLYNASAYHGM